MNNFEMHVQNGFREVFDQGELNGGRETQAKDVEGSGLRLITSR